MMPHRIGKMIVCAAGVAVLVGCSPRIDSRGNLPDPELVSTIKPGEQSKIEVEEILGSPSSVAAFDTNTWYYISKKTETVAFYQPDIVEQQVLVVRFDDKGIVSDVSTLSAEDSKAVEPVERETPTAGHSMTVIQQLFGNLGRFNKSKNGK